MVPIEDLIKNGFNVVEGWENIIYEKQSILKDHFMVVVYHDDNDGKRCTGVQFKHTSEFPPELGFIHKWTPIETIEEINQLYEKFNDLIS